MGRVASPNNVFALWVRLVKAISSRTTTLHWVASTARVWGYGVQFRAVVNTETLGEMAKMNLNKGVDLEYGGE